MSSKTMKIMVLAILMMVAVAVGCAAQTAPATNGVGDLGTYTCPANNNGLAFSRTYSTAPYIYLGGQCNFALRPNGHGTFHIGSEVGISGQPGLYEFTINLPVPIVVAEVHGNFDFINWCSILGLAQKADGFTMAVEGAVPGGPLEFITTAEAVSLTGEPKDYVINTTFGGGGVPVSALYFYHATDNCAWSTFKISLNGSF